MPYRIDCAWCHVALRASEYKYCSEECREEYLECMERRITKLERMLQEGTR